MISSSVTMESALREASFAIVTLPVKMSLMRATAHVHPTSSLVSVESVSLLSPCVMERKTVRMDQTKEAAVSKAL